MTTSRKFKVFLTTVFALAALFGVLFVVSWVLSHFWILLVLVTICTVGYYVIRKSALVGGRRTLI